MAGLVPAIHAFSIVPGKGGWVYILANRRNGDAYEVEIVDYHRG